MDRYTIHFAADGKLRKLEWPDGKKPALAWLQKAVGGYLELATRHIAASGKTVIAYVNEDGVRKELSFNANASELYGQGRRFVGDMIVLIGFGSDDDEENFEDWNPDTLGELATAD